MIHPKVLPAKHKILVPTKEVTEAAWNEHLPRPLRSGEKCIVSKEQTNVAKGYVMVKHGPKGDKSTSVFSQRNFVDIRGKNL